MSTRIRRNASKWSRACSAYAWGIRSSCRARGRRRRRAGHSPPLLERPPSEARFVCEVRPALQFESLIETMFTLAAEGKTNRKGMPNPLRLAVIAKAHFDTVRLPFPPAALQRAVLALAAPLGKALGYREPVTPAPRSLGGRASPLRRSDRSRHLGLAVLGGDGRLGRCSSISLLSARQRLPLTREYIAGNRALSSAALCR